MKRYLLGFISKFVCHQLQVEEVVLICQTIVMISVNVYWLVGVSWKEKNIQDVRLDWNIVGIAFANFLLNLKHAMKKCIWSGFTHDFTEVTRPIANLRYQHKKVCTIVKILWLVHTPTLWNCRNKLFYLQSQTFDSYLQKIFFEICIHIILIVFLWKPGIGSFYFACHKSGGWLRKSICYFKCIKKMSKCEKKLCRAIESDLRLLHSIFS